MEKAEPNSYMNVIDIIDPGYPEKLRSGNFMPPPEKIRAIGNLDILQEKLLGFFCSSRCPGDIILKTYDLARSWRDNGVVVIGGFHSPMEKECLDFLLRGRQPLVICPARGIQNMRISKNWRKPLDDGRLLILSPFQKKYRRPTVALATERNALVATLADELAVPYSKSGGRLTELVNLAISLGKKVNTC